MVPDAGLLDVPKESAKRRSRSERPDEVRKMSACSSDTHDVCCATHCHTKVAAFATFLRTAPHQCVDRILRDASTIALCDHAVDAVRSIQCVDAACKPRETTTLKVMSRISSAAQPRALTLTEELEKLEQSITLTLQGAFQLVSSRSLRLTLAEIDHNFSRAHRIVTSSILPIVEQYGGHSKEVWEGSRVRPSPLRKKEY